MSNPTAQQDALADITIVAARIHELRALAAEAETLLAAAMVTADRAGLTKTVVAEAAGLTRGRVSQIVTATPAGLDAAQQERITAINEFPGEALRGHRGTFSGRMVFPPYAARRRTVA